MGWKPWEVSEEPVTDERTLAHFGPEDRILTEYTETGGMNLTTGRVVYRKKRHRWDAIERRLFVEIWRADG